jgi:hypothetical protein
VALGPFRLVGGLRFHVWQTTARLRRTAIALPTSALWSSENYPHSTTNMDQKNPMDFLSSLLTARRFNRFGEVLDAENTIFLRSRTDDKRRGEIRNGDSASGIESWARDIHC